MKSLSILVTLIFLHGCVAIKDCAVAPTVEIKIEKQDNNNSKETEQKNKSTLETVKEVVEPGAQVVCRY
jgi:hypothetical protein